jgi:hypothetical protein
LTAVGVAVASQLLPGRKLLAKAVGIYVGESLPSHGLTAAF